jgi:hypothetical protein
MTVAEVDLLVVFVVEFDRGPADMAYLGRNFACDALALNLQGYFGRWKERDKFFGRKWYFSRWVSQFAQLGRRRGIAFCVQLDFPRERLVAVPLGFVLVAFNMFEGSWPIQLPDGI